MDYSIPPSYSEATNREWLPLLAPYLGTTSVYSASLVSRKWHDTVIRHLWGDPTSHFGIEGDRIYITLTRFLTALPKARLAVRELAHTIHLPPAQIELYDRLSFQWLRDILLYLPRLRCLVVSYIPFFDHAALLALKTLQSVHGEQLDRPQKFPLRLLLAANCKNSTSVTLGPALAQFPGLTFLDLSNTPTAREEICLHAIGSLDCLQILKLRHVGLRDQDLSILVDALNPREPGHPSLRHAYRLRSLDVRENQLTDISARIIAQRLIHPDPGIHGKRATRESRPRQGKQEQRLPSSQSSLIELCSVGLDKHFIRALTQSQTGHLFLEDLESDGLSHLYISDNSISMQGAISLIRAGNLYVLDIGHIGPPQHAARHHGKSFEAMVSTSSLTSLPLELGRLTGPLESCGSENLRYLRIHHAVVTVPAIETSRENNAVDSDWTNLEYAPPYDQPHYEAKATGGINQPTEAGTSHGYHRPPIYQMDDIHSRVTHDIRRLVDERNHLRYEKRHEQRGLIPGRLTRLQTLALTGVPALTRSRGLIQNIKDFVEDCAMEHHLACEQARLENILERFENNHHHDKTAARRKELFALQTIILELAPQRSGEPSEAEMTVEPDFLYSSNPSESRSSVKKILSSVNDQDADALWRAAKDDFSFFDDEDSGRPATDAVAVSLGKSHLEHASLSPDYELQPLRDVVAEIASWRTKKKKQHEGSDKSSFVPGFWPGEIKILKPNLRAYQEDVDFYGYHFGRGAAG